ncbi:MAG: gamma-glutamyl-gamma-aminobutyrate hydrolase family protein [Alphaproteobacteria bacterium]|nr:gamma-glutamyl-gamma-aminobutyrate hydrolase family protein [Alphaproteobacteria bacterium]
MTSQPGPARPKPLIGVTACLHRNEDGSVYFKVGEKYVMAIADMADAIPVMLPPLGETTDFDGVLDRLDGLFLTGSPSNVEPHHYQGPTARAGVEKDPARDATTLPLIRRALEREVPLFAVCRGHQELNVALGGSLHQHVEELPGKRDHRMQRDLPLEARYGQSHPVTIEPGGLLAAINGAAGDVMVNSLHAQGIDRLADGLAVEAVSDDGVIEAVSVTGARAFALGVQWHPEHRTALAWPLSQKMFKAFGAAAARRAEARAAGRRAA